MLTNRGAKTSETLRVCTSKELRKKSDRQTIIQTGIKWKTVTVFSLSEIHGDNHGKKFRTHI